MRIIMMPSCPYFIFIDTSIFKHVDIVFDFGFLLEDKQGLSLGELIRSFCIILLYQYLLHYGMLFHIMSQYLWLFSHILQGLHKEGECRQLEFWAGKGANIRDLFCTTPKVKDEKSSPKMKARGPTPYSRGWGAPPLGRAPYLVGPLVALR